MKYKGKLNKTICYGSIVLKSKLLKISFHIFVKATDTRSLISGFTIGKPILHDEFIILSKTFSVEEKIMFNY